MKHCPDSPLEILKQPLSYSVSEAPLLRRGLEV